jgi:hypothetical protein
MGIDHSIDESLLPVGQERLRVDGYHPSLRSYFRYVYLLLSGQECQYPGKWERRLTNSLRIGPVTGAHSFENACETEPSKTGCQGQRDSTQEDRQHTPMIVVFAARVNTVDG